MSYSGVDIWTQPNFSAGLPQELWQMNARGNAEFQQLYEAAYDEARRQGLRHDLAQDTAMRAARGIQGAGGIPDVWGDQRTVNLGGGLRRPVYPGAPRWSFESGSGLSAEETRRSRMTEQLVVEARNNALAARQQAPMELSTSGANAAKMDAALAGLQQQPQRTGSGGAALDPLSAGMAAADMAAVAADILPLTQEAVGAPDAAQAAVQSKAVARGVLSPHIQPGFAEAGGRVLSPVRPHIQPGFAETGGRVLNPLGPHVQPGFAEAGGQVLSPVRPHIQPGFAETGAAMPAIAEVGDASPDLIADATPNVSGGGPGTSTAKGQRNIASQRARRTEAARAAARRALAGRAAADAAAEAATAGSGFLGALDNFISQPGQSVGVMAERGLLRGADKLAGKMPGTAQMIRGLAPAARWAAPVGLFAATTGLPAAMGAMEGNEQAGAGGAVLQGGSALAGAAIGQALIPIPVVGAGIGAMVGNAVGSGLTSGAQMLAEQAQKGDTGLLGGLGRVLDPVIDTSFEREQKAVQQQLNSPAMQAIRQQERARQERARADQMEALLMQSYVR